MLKRITLVCLVLLIVLAGCSRNASDRDQKLEYGADTYRFTAVVVDQAGNKNLDKVSDKYGPAYMFTVKDYSPSFEIFKQYNDMYPSTNSYRALFLLENAHVYKITNDHQKVEVSPEELHPGTKIELWVSSFGEPDINEMFVHAKEVNILP